MDTYIDASYPQYLSGMPYIMPVSPWFYTNLPGDKKNWVWRGDHLRHDRWQEVLFVQSEFPQIISWNDYGEPHCVGPLYDKSMEAFKIGKAPFNYVTDMPHDGWRKHHLSGSTYTSKEPPTSSKRGFSPGSHFLLRRAWFISGVVISIGGDARTAAWTVVPDDNIGIYHGSQAFDGRTGPVTLSLMRDNVILTTIKGKPISAGCPHAIQNWNAWVGNATGDTVSISPKQTLSDQSCKKGTGANNFAGLCEFACNYSYCQLGGCTCTNMGMGYKKPNSTGVVGYPVAGEGAGYSGIRNFDFNLGYCPPSSCGTEDVPLVMPTVSPFLPPACTSGTGEGNLAGLCDFSCTHSFCPMNACTYTS